MTHVPPVAPEHADYVFCLARCHQILERIDRSLDDELAHQVAGDLRTFADLLETQPLPLLQPIEDMT